jgi:hypothetical protein
VLRLLLRQLMTPSFPRSGKGHPMSNDDSDETDGRALYRARANSLATAQIAMSKRKIKMSGTEPSPICPYDMGSDRCSLEDQAIGPCVCNLPAPVAFPRSKKRETPT